MNSILIVDDDPSIREICDDLLTENGYVVEKAGGGKSAMELLSKKKFNILLSDIQMPEMDGIALLKESRNLYPDMEVVLMTAYGGLQSAIEAIRFGAYDYITKPFSQDFLLRTIKRCMEKIELQQKLKDSQMKLVEQEKLAALGSVSAWISHRMRNALSVISMCAFYLKEKIGSRDGDLAEILSTISFKIKVLEKMTSDFIVYSRSYELQKSSENINAVIESAVSSISAQTQIQKVRLVQELDPHLPKTQCDPHILQEAFENIILNALQAIGIQKNQTIVIKSEILSDSELSAVQSANSDSIKMQTPVQLSAEQKVKSKAIGVSIANSGSIILTENLSKVFAPFYTTKENGSGLGLAIVKKTVDQHGGKIAIESGEKKGENWTTVKILFPVS